MKLVLDPDPILKQQAIDWNFELDGNTEEIEKEMISIMKSFNGRGLSGNQVGLLKRVFVITLDSTKETLAMFNPKIISHGNSVQQAKEGCLSFPDLWLKIKRPSEIEVEYLDKTGKECKMTLTGIDARCFLHELDHLDGITFTSKVGQMSLMLARKNQRKNKW